MDSGLLDVFHDDPFDGNYVKYDDNGADFWSSSSETMGMQLAETLHGILPIAPTDDASLLYGNTILKDDYGLDCKDDTMSALQTKHASIFDNFTEHHDVGTDESIEIVDPNEFESVDDDYDEDDDDNDDDDFIDMSDVDETALDDVDRLSQQSNITFRTRTDSSSIGDYESHSSDYDDDEECDNYVDDEDILLARSAFSYPLPVPDLTISSDLGAENNFNSLKLPTENYTPKNKNRTISTTTIGSDVDALGLHIDASTFDLAEFITEDDFAPISSLMPTKTINRKEEQPCQVNPEAFGIPAGTSAAAVQVISSKQVDSDSDDSDVIVDVETVEFDEETENQLFSVISTLPPLELEVDNTEELVFEDNVRSDPSWSPTKPKLKKELPAKEIKPIATTTSIKSQQTQQQQNFSRNLSLVPNKRQCDLLKGKFGSGRSKNGPVQRNAKPVINPSESKVETTNVKKKDEVPAETSASAKKQVVNKSKPDTVSTRKVLGVGQGGKNLALIKQRRCSLSEESAEKNPSPCKSNDSTPKNGGGEFPQLRQPDIPQLKAIKRKLNLEEYKQRRGGVGTGETNGSTSQRVCKLENAVGGDQQNSVGSRAQLPNTTQALSTSVATIVQSLKAQATQPKFAVDPITEAKNKVLRMQEQKKAQLLKIIDSTVSAKVPRVTKILPLKDIVKDSAAGGGRKDSAYSTANGIRNSSAPVKYETDYEEIVIVSASTNTEISIPPLNILPNCLTDISGTLKHANNASRSLLKSSALLYNISNTFQKVRASENVKLTPNSLITSIHRVVAKQTSIPLGAASESLRKDGLANLNCSKTYTTSSNVIVNKVNKAEQHGEDKIIMHLRKDRIRNRTCSASMQTEILPEFPPLLMLTKIVERKSRERKRMRNVRRNCRQRHPEGSQREYESEDFSCSDDEHSSYRSQSRSTVPVADSCSSPSDRLRRSDVAGVGGAGYSSRSSRHHRSSISSSYSESERIATRRSRKSYIKQRSSKKHSRSRSNSSIEYSDCSRSRSRNRHRRRSHRSDARSYSRSRSRSRSSTKRCFVDRNVSQPAVEERRIVYVGRIEQDTNKEMLRRKFVLYGPIKQITIHYKDTGMKYGFVTYERSQDAFTVIDNSSRDPHINMYDISFGGRRAFCRASYADLDNAGINTYQSIVFPQVAPEPKEEDSFEALLLKVKAKMNANKSSSNAAII